MKNKTQDLRYRKTDQKIRQVFVTLLRSVGYPKITVSLIIKHAAINRSTFYDHYLDKEDLMSQLQLTFIENLTLNLPELNVAAVSNQELINHRIDTLIERLYAERETIRLYLSDRSDGRFTERLTSFAQQLFVQTDIVGELIVPEKYAISAVSGVMLNLIVTWIQADFHESPAEFSNIVNTIAPNLFKIMLK
ncbi:TetR/AcrR family transcriptional regulator [Periweissella fabaria]|nr:TetR/AcrR family transcriptional regulator [Periweissella fabaria]MCM0596967.1 TetR/AcrR family transcriptional regulator [Periweissella fabaria]